MSDRRVLVCGGRDFQDKHAMFRLLDLIQPIPDVLINGGARGADTIAAEWARQRYVTTITVYAKWEQHDKAAGPMRNAEMLKLWKPTLVIAFPGGSGTADMVKQARKAGVEVVAA